MSVFATHEHPEDVVEAALAFRMRGQRVAMVVVTQTEGGGVRAPGAMMAVSEGGQAAGYVSGGCVDEDVRLNAIAAIEAGEPRGLRYGSGSRFLDIRLPCGGAIDLQVCPCPDDEILQSALEELKARRPVSMGIDSREKLCLGTVSDAVFCTEITPKLRLRIAGRGSDCLALARIAMAAGVKVQLQLPDEQDCQAAAAEGVETIDHLSVPSALPALSDDAWTAFVLMFHDTQWETALLKQALTGPAFYVGAVGSERTQALRQQALLDADLREQDVQRVRGPIGLVPSLRDSSWLAISTLAEIVDAHRIQAASCS